MIARICDVFHDFLSPLKRRSHQPRRDGRPALDGALLEWIPEELAVSEGSAEGTSMADDRWVAAADYPAEFARL